MPSHTARKRENLGTPTDSTHARAHTSTPTQLPHARDPQLPGRHQQIPPDPTARDCTRPRPLALPRQHLPSTAAPHHDPPLNHNHTHARTRLTTRATRPHLHTTDAPTTAPATATRPRPRRTTTGERRKRGKREREGGGGGGQGGGGGGGGGGGQTARGAGAHTSVKHGGYQPRHYRCCRYYPYPAIATVAAVAAPPAPHYQPAVRNTACPAACTTSIVSKTTPIQRTLLRWSSPLHECEPPQRGLKVEFLTSINYVSTHHHVYRCHTARRSRPRQAK